MSFCAQQILALASGVYQEIGSPSSQSPAYISGWMTESGNLGDLNNKLSTSFILTGDSTCITDGCGGFGGEEAAIYTLMYKSDYYELMSLQALQGGGTFWTSMAEGDTRLTRSNIVDISKAYLALNDQSNQFLRLAIHDYKLRIIVPQGISAEQSYQAPTPA